MRDVNALRFTRAMPAMSWEPRNLWNFVRRFDEYAGDMDFSQTQKTLFQQRWLSKALVRAYHGDFINEGSFKRWYLPGTLPDVRPRTRVRGDDKLELAAVSGRGEQARKVLKREEEEAKQALAPVGSLMFAELERRIDVFIFRCCLAASVYDARRMVMHGHVFLNGKRHTNHNCRLAPGDMVTVDSSAIRFIQPKATGWKVTDLQPDRQKSLLKELPRRLREQIARAEERAKSSETSDESPASGSKSPAAQEDTQFAWKESYKDLTPFALPAYASPWIFIPAYAEVNFRACSAVYVRHPTARAGYSEIPTPYDADGGVVRSAWEWYVGRRPRIRSAKQLARSPQNRSEHDVRADLRAPLEAIERIERARLALQQKGDRRAAVMRQRNAFNLRVGLRRRADKLGRRKEMLKAANAKKL